MRFVRLAAASVLVGTLIGCDASSLAVPNPNNPDRPRILASDAEVEALSSAQFQQVVAATLGAGTGSTGLQRPQLSMLTMAFENAAALANNGMGPRSNMPRGPIDNSRGNAYDVENFSTFRMLSAVARNSSDILKRAYEPTFTLGAGEAGINRLKGWTYFISGVSHGYLAMTYDSASIARPSDDPLNPPGLSSYHDVHSFAMAQLDSALVYLGRQGVPDIPQGWLTGPGGNAVTVANFTRVVRSFRARMRAGVARTPQERAAVDWEAVIADAEAGIQSNLVVGMNRNQQWDFHWLHTSYHFRDANWHQMPYQIIGMADVSGGFDNWLATHRDSRTPFTIVTPDQRFPRGGTRAAQNRAVADEARPLPRRELPGDTLQTQYFRNRRAGLDQAGTGWRLSQYDHYRFRAFADGGGVGDLPIFTRAENDMLAAEGHIRANRISQAAQLIDRTRAAAGLPALAGVVTTANQPVPGGDSCVPRVPQAPNFTSTECGTILEAMKWEKRIEMAYTTFGGWYFDSRGWGDLPAGTAVHWPTPVQELLARLQPTYNVGGQNDPTGGAGPSTYGYGSGER